ncbi:DUF1643 domain-containing protein [Latilactobacillus graminis]|uniref:DUF1643 domain-containing protein n=2 Tax=Latilactobacillus graminis TaxID=60519 RepID=A0AA89I220_9LACO|nr:DUF1643 domain-containing protein [Latilactobacillus graminis]KRM24216.1 hypothetical protein FC90_GL000693 [Latilactobacillus graminis DSM 20719]QFP78803.1 DUF1643 domain-containing protein [Latilactobacillus graminis]
MKQAEQTTMLIESKFSADGQNRYMVKRVWDGKKRQVMVISNYPTSANGIQSDLTMMKITNNLYELGYGGFVLCNVFSSLKGAGGDPKREETALGVIRLEAAHLDEVILATSTFTKKNKRAKKRLQEVLSVLDNKNIKLLVDEKGSVSHPLKPVIKRIWYLKEKK